MNKQKKFFSDGTTRSRGIEWTDYTYNPIAGCQHGCRWRMPDGKIARCYAENVAENLAQSAYPNGFEFHYWKPEILDRPLRIATPSRIFVGSMADVFGAWATDEQINAVFEICRLAHWHTFLFLTKNAPRLLQFDFPNNCWIGFSTPPDFMLGRELMQTQKDKMLHRALEVFEQVKARIKWVSVEPLSWDCAHIFAEHKSLEWAVIGAASNGKQYYQPNQAHVLNLLDYFDGVEIPVFFKGNLAWEPHRESFPKEN